MKIFQKSDFYHCFREFNNRNLLETNKEMKTSELIKDIKKKLQILKVIAYIIIGMAIAVLFYLCMVIGHFQYIDQLNK